MKLIAETNFPKKIRCEIEHDEKAGYYLYVWENGIGIDDDLQDTLQFAKEAAMEYGIPLDAWQQVED